MAFSWEIFQACYTFWKYPFEDKFTRETVEIVQHKNVQCAKSVKKK